MLLTVTAMHTGDREQLTGALYKATALLIVSEGKFHHASAASTIVPLWVRQPLLQCFGNRQPPLTPPTCTHTYTHTHTHTHTHTTPTHTYTTHTHTHTHTHTPTGIERSLLYTVSQVPIRRFSAAALSVAVGCWQWLLTKRPDLEYPVSYVLQCVHITNRLY